MTSHNGRETLPVASKLPSRVYVLFPPEGPRLYLNPIDVCCE